MAGFTVTLKFYSRALTNICVDEVPDPHSRPTTVRQGNGNGGLLYIKQSSVGVACTMLAV